MDTTNIISIAIGLLALVVFLFIAKRLLRLAIKMTLVGLVIVALLVGAGLGWWNGWFGSTAPSKPPPQRRASPARPTPAR
jgi:multisubunit Na+/H+ antiporter MnhC subunit